jgi:hypothetical protein
VKSFGIITEPKIVDPFNCWIVAERTGVATHFPHGNFSNAFKYDIAIARRCVAAKFAIGTFPHPIKYDIAAERIAPAETALDRRTRTRPPLRGKR